MLPCQPTNSSSPCARKTVSCSPTKLERAIRIVENGIKPAYVFDGKPPELKTRKEAKKEGEEAKETETAEDIYRFSRQTSQHNEECRKLLALMEIPVVIAPSEPEAQCTELAKGGKPYHLRNGLWCLVVDHANKPVGDIFDVDAALSLAINKLKKKILASEDGPTAFRQRKLTAADIFLWKPTEDVPYDKIETTEAWQLNRGTGREVDGRAILLGPFSTVGDEFSSPPPARCVHVLVQMPPREDRNIENEFNEAPNRGMKRRRAESDDLITERKRLAKMAKNAPSSLSKPSAFQDSAQQVVACNRPFDFDTIPITLLQEEFGCKVLPSPKSQELLQALTVAACKWHENETKRRSEIQEVLNDVAGLNLAAETIAGTEYKTNGNLRVNIMPPVIRECKNEAGCALLEAIAYYVQFLVKVLDRRRMRNRFPCILLIDTGSYFGLYGCLWTGEHLHVEPLTPFYDLTIHWTDESGRQAIAASLDAFLKAIPRLEAHYAQLASIAPIPFPNPSLLDRAYPYKTSYEDENGQHINFSYRFRIAEKLVFVAAPDKSGDKYLGTLCIKFTRRYSEDAHLFLAQLGYAPRLRAVMRLPGGWNMVVMDYSEYTQLCDPRLQISDELRHTVKAKVSEIVQKLHDAGFVHGDIRSLNVLVDCGTSNKDGIKIHFIDFDWAGRQREAVYPTRVNKVTVWRPEGASDGKPVLYLHVPSRLMLRIHPSNRPDYAIANKLTRLISMQNHHSLVYREEEREMFPTLKYFGVGSIPWSPLRRGLLTRPLSEGTTRSKVDGFIESYSKSDATSVIVNRVEEIAKKHQVSMAQVSLAWIMSKATSRHLSLDRPQGCYCVQLAPEEIKYLEEPYTPQRWMIIKWRSCLYHCRTNSLIRAGMDTRAHFGL
ncbi:hypothetical protein F5887DRAFT_1206316 [Amanita rubescens]|nr:hypothetical protein F5887DRAFT_1206316 [Amanita rubescens]